MAGNKPASAPAAAVIQTWTMTKTGGVNGTYDAGASSVQTIVGDGYIEFTVGATLQDRVIGFSVLDPDAAFAAIPVCLILTSDATPALYKGESGAFTSLTSTYAVDDVLRIEASGAVITYYLNGVALSPTSARPVGALRVDTSIATASGVIGGIKFFDAGVQVALTWQNVTNVSVVQP